MRTNETTQNVKETIYAINKSSIEIDSIVKTINSIAEQTNLLALNASIEAARTGENGKGFAVVVEQSSKSANEIRELIDHIRNQTIGAVKEMEEIITAVEAQNQAVENTGSSFKAMSLSIENLASNVEKIDHLNKEMVKIKEQMFEIIQSVADMAKNTSASTQEMSAYVEDQLYTMTQVRDMLTASSTTATKLGESIKIFKTE
ncbi:methyl-accepting chemotaxis protein [Cellulosilyticum ruminicola]|uniref:methyl-accepting chemotaxis protein n=1 Tax=Cellulosilyticum ruminicola TaxID=425254 RepID=UPI0006D202DD|nr:methyl-accepting chemotaxis protein [Cellulosilyticum ruminicola]